MLILAVGWIGNLLVGCQSPESLNDMPLKRLEKISFNLGVKHRLMWVDFASCLYLYCTIFYLGRASSGFGLSCLVLLLVFVLCHL